VTGSIVWPSEHQKGPVLPQRSLRRASVGTIVWPRVMDWKHSLAMSLDLVRCQSYHKAVRAPTFCLERPACSVTASLPNSVGTWVCPRRPRRSSRASAPRPRLAALAASPATSAPVIPVGRWASRFKPRAIATNWRVFTTKSTIRRRWSITTSHRRSSSSTRPRAAGGWGCCTRPATSSCGRIPSAGKSGRWRRSWSDSQTPCPTGTAGAKTVSGIAHPGRSTPSRSGSPIGCAPRPRSIGFSSAICSCSRTTCGPIARQWMGGRTKQSGRWSHSSPGYLSANCSGDWRGRGATTSTT